MAATASDLVTPVLLVAMPQVLDPFFHKSVVLLIHHQEEGSFGFIVNRPTGIKVSEILHGLEVGWRGREDALAYFGGPVQPQLGTVLFEAERPGSTDAAAAGASSPSPGSSSSPSSGSSSSSSPGSASTPGSSSPSAASSSPPAAASSPAASPSSLFSPAPKGSRKSAGAPKKEHDEAADDAEDAAGEEDSSSPGEADPSDSITQLAGGISLTQHVGDLSRLAERPPERFRLYLGYAGWGAGQLIAEILRNDWLTAPVTGDLIFAPDPEKVWNAALQSVGVDPSSLPSWTTGATHGEESAN